MPQVAGEMSWQAQPGSLATTFQNAGPWHDSRRGGKASGAPHVCIPRSARESGSKIIPNTYPVGSSVGKREARTDIRCLALG